MWQKISWFFQAVPASSMCISIIWGANEDLYYLSLIFPLWVVERAARPVFAWKMLLRVRSFGMIQIRISDPRSLGSWRIEGTEESTLGKHFSVPLMRHDLSDLGSLIPIWIIPKERTLNSFHAHVRPPFLCTRQLMGRKKINKVCLFRRGFTERKRKRSFYRKRLAGALRSKPHLK